MMKRRNLTLIFFHFIKSSVNTTGFAMARSGQKRRFSGNRFVEIPAYCSSLLINLPKRKIGITHPEKHIICDNANSGKMHWSRPRRDMRESVPCPDKSWEEEKIWPLLLDRTFSWTSFAFDGAPVEVEVKKSSVLRPMMSLCRPGNSASM